MEPRSLMHARRRLMGTEPSMEAYSSNRTQNSYMRDTNFDTNMVIILAALLCALVFALGLNTILRCAMRCSRWFSVESAEQAAARVASTGLKKRELRKIPVAVYGSTEVEVPVTECPICLEEFVKGDKVRVLPKCSHGFHVRCIDTWLVSHSSCPNCRLSLLECQTGSCASAAQPEQQHQEEEENISRTGQQSAEQAGVVVVVDEGG